MMTVRIENSNFNLITWSPRKQAAQVHSEPDLRVKMVENFEFGTPVSARRTDSGNKVNEFEPDSVVLLWVWAHTAVLPPRRAGLRPFRGRLHARGACGAVLRATAACSRAGRPGR